MNSIIINLLNDPYFNGEYKRRLAVIRNMDSQQKNQELMEILKDDSTYVITNYWIRNNEYDIKKILEFLDFRVNE